MALYAQKPIHFAHADPAGETITGTRPIMVEVAGFEPDFSFPYSARHFLCFLLINILRKSPHAVSCQEMHPFERFFANLLQIPASLKLAKTLTATDSPHHPFSSMEGLPRGAIGRISSALFRIDKLLHPVKPGDATDRQGSAPAFPGVKKNGVSVQNPEIPFGLPEHRFHPAKMIHPCGWMPAWVTI